MSTPQRRLTRSKRSAAPWFNRLVPRPIYVSTVALLCSAGTVVHAQTNLVTVRTTKELAKVSSQSLYLRDLMPLNATTTQLTISRDQLLHLLRRAIERELLIQEAGRLGVGLTAEQQSQLDTVRQATVQREGDAPGVVHLNPQGTLTQRITFEQREARALMLRANLVARLVATTAHVTREQVVQYYQEHQSEFGTLPQDPAEREIALRQVHLTIRKRLAPIVRAEYEQRVQEYLQQIKSAAVIVINP